jgi:polar amino acid transport system permease protein
MRLSDSFAARALVRIYLEVIRNTPLLVQLFLFFYILAPIFGVDRFWTGVLALSFFEGAHAMEIFRAGILSVGRGQWEASDSLGLSTVDTYRFIVLPQALRLVLPPLTGLVITLVKHSAIVSAIAIADLTTEGRNVIADTFLSFEIWFTVAGMYLVLTIALSLLVSYLESRLRIRY